MSTKKTQTHINKYKSPSTGDFCTPAQYIAEIICQRCAKHEKVGTLPYKFWNLPKWKKIYIRQVSLANKLIKEYSNKMQEYLYLQPFLSCCKVTHNDPEKGIRLQTTENARSA